ncbi:MAG TPA: tetratricopeptide repeat protein [Phototrophicaceae bacterium]|jgi:tetratricopeptide (TPR) repeat protein|nr:tetratricopeptide repeat protein [Phototrophicaceae bacterium]
MSQNVNDALIGKAWGAHRLGRNGEAIRDFEQVIKSDGQNVDAYYGLGLAQRASGQTAEAQAAFEKALALAKQKTAEIQGARHEHNLESDEDDRYMMLTRMLSQRLEELGRKSN